MSLFDYAKKELKLLGWTDDKRVYGGLLAFRYLVFGFGKILEWVFWVVFFFV